MSGQDEWTSLRIRQATHTRFVSFCRGLKLSEEEKEGLKKRDNKTWASMDDLLNILITRMERERERKKSRADRLRSGNDETAA